MRSFNTKLKSSLEMGFIETGKCLSSTTWLELGNKHVLLGMVAVDVSRLRHVFGTKEPLHAFINDPFEANT
jgi:hypothetical protein